MEKVKVAIWGFGAMGRGIAEMLSEKEGVEIVGVCDISPDLKGKPVADLLENKEIAKEDVVVTENIDGVLKTGADVLFIATDSYTRKSFEKIKKGLTHKINIISTAEEMAYPYANEPELSKEIDALAKENDVTVLGTGVNPGFVMDFLAIAMTGAMKDIESIEIRRVNSLSPFGPTVMEEQGVGISMEEFEKKMANNDLAGHVGFKESVFMIADALGIEIQDFEQQMKPIVTSVDRKSRYGEAKKGHVAGIDMTAQGYVNNKKFIDMKHPQQIEPEMEGTQTGDYITIHGTPEVNLSITPEIDGGVGTIATCVNMMPHVINSEPGLKTMINLPVPRAILGDVRKLIKK